MDIKEYGKQNKRSVVLIHPSLVSWDYFRDVIPLLEESFRLFIPVLPGYDLSDDSDFSAVESVASEIGERLAARDIGAIHAVYGCSMGGSIVLRMAVDGKVEARHFILDGGITPYQLPRVLTRPIALRDFLMVSLGKLGGERLITRAFSSTSFSDEDYRYIAAILRHCSYKTIWNTFDSCNNYDMPKRQMRFDAQIHYWCAEAEVKARKWDIRYMKRFVPDTVFKVFPGIDHGDMAAFKPGLFADEIKSLD